MKVGDRHLGWSHPGPKIHVVTVTWVGELNSGPVLTARTDCGQSSTAVLEETKPERRGDLCHRCERKAPEFSGNKKQR